MHSWSRTRLAQLGELLSESCKLRHTGQIGFAAAVGNILELFRRAFSIREHEAKILEPNRAHFRNMVEYLALVGVTGVEPRRVKRTAEAAEILQAIEPSGSNTWERL